MTKYLEKMPDGPCMLLVEYSPADSAEPRRLFAVLALGACNGHEQRYGVHLGERPTLKAAYADLAMDTAMTFKIPIITKRHGRLISIHKHPRTPERDKPPALDPAEA